MTAASLLGSIGELAPSDRRNRTQARFGRGNLARLIAIMATVALVGTGIATGLLYNTAFDGERIRLVELVRSQVNLIEAVAKFDARFSGDDHDGGAIGATISQIQSAHRDYRGLRSTGQFHLARRKGDRLEYLLSHQQRGFGAADVPAASMKPDGPMERALAGATGTMVTLGHNGEEVLAAYEPIPSLNLGLLAKVSVREIRAPFIKAATISGAVTLILILLGALSVHRVNGSLIRRLHKSVADLNTAQRIAKIGHWDWNIRTGELHWTDEIYRVFGQEPQAFAASYDGFLEAVHPDDRASVVEAVDRAVKEGARYDIEHRIVRSDGQVRTVHEQGEVTRDRDGAPIHMTGTVHDITERKQAEELGQRFGRILDSSFNEIYVFDAASCRFVQVNEGAQRNLGYDMEELRAMATWDIKTEIDEVQFQEMVKPLRDGGTEVLRFETVHQRKDGSEYPVEVHLQLFADESPPVFVAIVLDITIRKLAENQVRMLNEDLERRVEARTREFEDANNSLQETLAYLSQTQEQLVEAEKMASLGGLVAGVAHEINTPVGIGVTAASHLRSGIVRLRQAYERDEMKRTDLESFLSASTQSSDIILANLRRASDLIKSFKQVAVDQSSDEVRRFNLRSYLDEIVTSLGPKIKKSGHAIEVACSDSIDINGHPGALAQIVTNLVTNSLTHAYDDGQSGILHIAASREDDRIHLVYRDDGKGIPEQNLPHIFEPFFTTRRGQGGSGLGLNITYNLATQTLRGSIGCTSTAGEGTEFRLSFPAELGERS